MKSRSALSPSLFFYAFPTDRAFRAAAWAGVVLSLVALTGVAQRAGAPGRRVWAALWVLYLSFVNVGQTFYGFGWESLLRRDRVLHDLRGRKLHAAARAADLDLSLDAVPADVRRRTDQAARRCVLARSDVPRLLLRNAADAESAQLVPPPPAAVDPPRRRRLQPLRRADRAVRVLPAAALCRHRRSRSPSSSS